MERTTRMGGLSEQRTTFRYNDHDDPTDEISEDHSRGASMDSDGVVHTSDERSEAQHTRFDYQYDDHGNWTERIVWSRIDERGGIPPYERDRSDHHVLRGGLAANAFVIWARVRRGRSQRVQHEVTEANEDARRRALMSPLRSVAPRFARAVLRGCRDLEHGRHSRRARDPGALSTRSPAGSAGDATCACNGAMTERWKSSPGIRSPARTQR